MGTFFENTQHGPDLLAYAVQHAVGDDRQAFAQRNLFGPSGIKESDYFLYPRPQPPHVWLRLSFHAARRCDSDW
ncbi:hypothetical protein [Gordonia sp. SL306]|uniref:hypothetical protein n=1 Tax=Gordonia sp. SL306 TaxID=2995145 RepID=UPI0022722B08|nr:hypothetical protein [Gordonia sp. SL306]WAC57548.1 hypothetical protein OVA31_10100 [Gordonia sp. SL306]